jgi:Raf kinase inhibitor-like YbhB/YbcL family protein
VTSSPTCDAINGILAAPRAFHLPSQARWEIFNTMTNQIHVLFAALSFALLAAGCSPAVPGNLEELPALQVTSAAFADGQPIPEKYTGHGDDVSPPLQWTGAPSQTKSFAITFQDPDAPMGTFTHWVIFNLPATTTNLLENVAKTGSLPDGSKQGQNSFGNTGYNGPAPPSGKTHHYIFTVYALGAMLNLDAGASENDVQNAMLGHQLAQGQLTGTYQSQLKMKNEK